MNQALTRTFFLLIFFISLLIPGCENFRIAGESGKYPADLDKIRENGRLVVVTGFNSVSYFIYKGEPMGFNYELLEAFSDHLGIDIELIAENDPGEAVRMLNSGEADLAVTGFNSDSRAAYNIQLSEPLGQSAHVIVQKKPVRSGDPGNTSGYISNIEELAGKQVFVQKGSPFASSLKALAEEYQIRTDIVEVPLDPEQLISLVDDGEISYTVCNEDLARVNAGYHPGLDVAIVIGPERNHSWAVRIENSDELLKELNNWIISYRSTNAYAQLYSKYYRNARSRTIFNSDYYALSTGRVSQWDEIIKTCSDSIDWDWRLLASLICQESRFNPDVTSGAGAYGLMQIMPETGKSMGIDITLSPRNNILAGIKYIGRLNSMFHDRIPDENERIRFILASYNAGPGHVLDAMRLAGKNGHDPLKWEDNVALWMLKKSEPEYYNDKDVKNGYFRGRESVAFVNEILDRYQHYTNIIQ